MTAKKIKFNSQYIFKKNANFTDAFESWDLLAVEALNDALTNFVLSDCYPDIFCLNLYEKINLLSMKKIIKEAAKRGVFFEVPYTRFIEEPDRQAVFISNFAVLYGFLKGENIVITSGAKSVFEQRSPNDVKVMFSTVFDIPKDKVEKMISGNCEKLLKKASYAVSSSEEVLQNSYKTNLRN